MIIVVNKTYSHKGPHLNESAVNTTDRQYSCKISQSSFVSLFVLLNKETSSVSKAIINRSTDPSRRIEYGRHSGLLIKYHDDDDVCLSLEAKGVQIPSKFGLFLRKVSFGLSDELLHF